MSQRAYVLKTVMDDKGFTMRVDYDRETFNVSTEQNVTDKLNEHCNFFDYLNDDICGEACCKLEDLKRAVAELKSEGYDTSSFDRDIKEAEEDNAEEVVYYVV